MKHTRLPASRGEATPTVRVLHGFDDPALAWEELPADEVFQTRAWLRTWWTVFGRGRLLLVQARRGAGPPLLLPLFADGGMGYFVGAGGSDYLDFVGASELELLAAALDAAREGVPGFLGFQFHLVPDDSPTAARLAQVSPQLGLQLCAEDHLPAPVLDLQAGVAGSAAARAGLVRAERWFSTRGELVVQHLRSAAEVEPHLEAFFAQHIARWHGTPHPSLFLQPVQREFYRQLTHSLGESGALRFTRIGWNGEPIAFHFGCCHRGAFLWYKPSFAPAHARRSPGQVLLRALLLAAADEGATRFDFGIGDEAFKTRFANRARTVRTWGLYPRGS